MSETAENPPAEAVPVDPQRLWIAAQTTAERLEVVRQHPILATIYAEAHTLAGQIARKAPVLLAFCALLLGATAHAGIVFGSLSTVNNTTTNSTVLQTNTLNIPIGTLLVANGGLTATNALVGRLQFSTDGTNFINVGPVYTPTITNATTDTILPQVVAVPVYFRLSATTTNSVSVGATYLYP